jgi:hypothetical protein
MLTFIPYLTLRHNRTVVLHFQIMEKKDKGDWTANEAADYAANCITGRSE